MSVTQSLLFQDHLGWGAELGQWREERRALYGCSQRPLRVAGAERKAAPWTAARVQSTSTEQGGVWTRMELFPQSMGLLTKLSKCRTPRSRGICHQNPQRCQGRAGPGELTGRNLSWAVASSEGRTSSTITVNHLWTWNLRVWTPIPLLH